MDYITTNVKNISLNTVICNLCRKKFNKIHNTNFCNKCSKLVVYDLEKMKTVP
jgi:predicted amidophosphoribosyltransferase